jgi:hypothetical protein
MLDAPRDFSSGQCGAESMKWFSVAFDCLSHARALLRSSSVEMPMMVYRAPVSLQASCSSEAASLRHGLHQLAQTLMISGRPLKLASDRRSGQGRGHRANRDGAGDAGGRGDEGPTQDGGEFHARIMTAGCRERRTQIARVPYGACRIPRAALSAGSCPYAPEMRFAMSPALRNIRGPDRPRFAEVFRMSGLSLREQLLQAGLVSEKQVKQAEQSQKRQNFNDRKQVSKKDRDFREQQRQVELQKQAEIKAAKDAALNKKREEKAQAKARWAEIRQLVEQNRIPKPESDDYFNFVINGKVGRVAVDAPLRERIVRGEIAIVRCDGHYELVPQAIGERIKEREPRAVVNTADKQEATPVDDAYKDFVVPDDLIW